MSFTMTRYGVRFPSFDMVISRFLFSPANQCSPIRGQYVRLLTLFIMENSELMTSKSAFCRKAALCRKAMHLHEEKSEIFVDGLVYSACRNKSALVAFCPSTVVSLFHWHEVSELNAVHRKVTTG